MSRKRWQRRGQESRSRNQAAAGSSNNISSCSSHSSSSSTKRAGKEGARREHRGIPHRALAVSAQVDGLRPKGGRGERACLCQLHQSRIFPILPMRVVCPRERERGCGRPRLRAGVDGAFTAWCSGAHLSTKLCVTCHTKSVTRQRTTDNAHDVVFWRIRRGCTSAVANGVGYKTDGGKPRAREVGHEAAPGLL